MSVHLASDHRPSVGDGASRNIAARTSAVRGLPSYGGPAAVDVSSTTRNATVRGRR